ncbi:MAG: hypothetical protein LBQ12_08510 [Deltaproteobacteria bacterium]|nr:hypothetical protein [Deltaproteobacteria bacterium]
MTDPVQLGVNFRRAVRNAGLPTRIFASLFKMDGRAFAGWKFRGVPPELSAAVEEVTEVLRDLVKAKMLPMDLNELAYLGLEALSERLAKDERRD